MLKPWRALPGETPLVSRATSPSGGTGGTAAEMSMVSPEFRIAVEISGLSGIEGLRQTHVRGCRAAGVLTCRTEDGSMR